MMILANQEVLRYGSATRALCGKDAGGKSEEAVTSMFSVLWSLQKRCSKMLVLKIKIESRPQRVFRTPYGPWDPTSLPTHASFLARFTLPTLKF